MLVTHKLRDDSKCDWGAMILPIIFADQIHALEVLAVVRLFVLRAHELNARNNIVPLLC